MARSCDFEGCPRPHFAKGYCNTHYCRIRRNGTLLVKGAHGRQAASDIGTCGVHGCSRPGQCRASEMRVCLMHYKRWKAKGEFGPAQAVRPRNTNKTSCAVEACSDMQVGNRSYCHMHDTRFRRHGDPLRVVPISERKLPRGPDNPNWSGDSATYSAMHLRVRKARGSASEHACVDCGKRAQQWAYDRKDPEVRDSNFGPYSVHLCHYEARCIPCHKRFDLEAIRGAQGKG